MLNNKIIAEIENKIILDDDPFPHTVINNFLPLEIVKVAEEEFIKMKNTNSSGNEMFQKTKKHFEIYQEMPNTIKKIIDFFHSKNFIELLEKKFNLQNVEPDWSLRGGGMHESFKGGFLKIHSDFIYLRKSKHRRVLNLLLYLNSNWEKDWGGSIEFWDKNMKELKKTVLPIINNAVIFRTDTDGNHGFPEPINCPENISRKSIAIYYYVKEKTFLPISIRRRKLYHAVWKKRPNAEEPKFADNDNFFKRLKHKFFYRFF